MKTVTGYLSEAGRVLIANKEAADKYNSCLLRFGLQAVAEAPFHIDAFGFSFEIAERLGNLDYLTPGEYGRRFVLIDTAQLKGIPSNNMRDTWSAGLLMRFTAQNRDLISRLLLSDAVFGSIEGLPADTVTVKTLLTTARPMVKAQTLFRGEHSIKALQADIAAFKGNRDLWTDRAAMEKIVGQAKVTGDVRNAKFEFQVETGVLEAPFAYCGGVSVFDETILTLQQMSKEDAPEGALAIDGNSGGQVLGHLLPKGVIEQFNPRWLKQSGIILDRAVGIACDLLPDEFFSTEEVMDEKRFRELMIKEFGRLAAEPKLVALLDLNEAIERQDFAAADKIERAMNARTRLSLRRSVPGRSNAEAVNFFLAYFASFDPVATFMANKSLFWAEMKKRPLSKQLFWARRVHERVIGREELVAVGMFGENHIDN